ncbi:MAG TPA: restriction endonuclease subunit S, partial [Pyrinomonadaceae bacterium]
LSDNSQNREWVNVSLDDVCIIQNGQIDPTISPYRDMIHIAPDDIESETGRILEQNTAAADGISSGNYEFTEGAILYSKIRPNLRKVAFPRFRGVCSADVYPIYPKPNLLPEVLFHILLSENFTDYAVAHSVRSAIPKLNRQAMLKYRFKLPPRNEQDQLLEVLRTISLSTESVKRHVEKSKELKRSLLSSLIRI